MEKHILSKSTFIRGHQCLKSLYLYKKRYFLRDRLSDEQRIKFKRGHFVGEIAQNLFPGGIDVRPKAPSQYKKAVMSTSEEIEGGADIIYEAGFQYDQVIVFMDVLFKKDGHWHACEVKSSKGISDTYILDAALQYYVISGSGTKLKTISIAHIDEEYVLEDQLEINRLFKQVDVTEKVLGLQAYVKEQIIKEKATLELEHSPKIEVGPHCRSPYPCDFIGHCWKNVKKENKVIKLVSDTLLSKEEGEVLPSADGNIKFLHISTFRPAIPIYKGTRPYQEIPFQFSILDEKGQLHEYLLPAGQHPDGLIKIIHESLVDIDVLVVFGYRMQDAGSQMPVPSEVEGQDAGWAGRIIDLMGLFNGESLSDVAKELLGDDSLSKLKYNKEILVAEAYQNMLNDNELQYSEIINEYGNTSVRLIKNLYESIIKK